MMKRAFAFSAIITAGIALNALAQPSVMPKQLVDFAKSRSCEPVTDFFDREGLVDPPYALGYLPGQREASAVFFCRRGNDIFLMVAMFDGQTKFSCPTEIRYPGYPGGLRILTGKKVPLNWFRYFEAPHGYGPKTSNTSGPIIQDYYDGVQDWFYCHNGKWLRRFLH